MAPTAPPPPLLDIPVSLNGISNHLVTWARTWHPGRASPPVSPSALHPKSCFSRLQGHHVNRPFFSSSYPHDPGPAGGLESLDSLTTGGSYRLYPTTHTAWPDPAPCPPLASFSPPVMIQPRPILFNASFPLGTSRMLPPRSGTACQVHPCPSSCLPQLGCVRLHT